MARRWSADLKVGATKAGGSHASPREQARGEESGSKLPHSKASLRMPQQIVHIKGKR